MKKITFEYPREQLKALIPLCLLMTGVSVFLVYMGFSRLLPLPAMGPLSFIVYVFVGLIGTLYFGFILLYLIHRFLFPAPLLELTGRGMIDCSTAFAARTLIPYESIRKVTIVFYLGQRYIGVDLKDEESFLEEVSFFKRTAMKLNRQFSKKSLILIQLNGRTRVETEELVKEINQRRRLTKKSRQD